MLQLKEFGPYAGSHWKFVPGSVLDEKRKKVVFQPFEEDKALKILNERPGNSQYLPVGRIS